MLIADFNEEFRGTISCEEGETLEDLLKKNLAHLPVKGESIRIDSFLFTVVEPTLTGVKSLTVHTLSDS